MRALTILALVFLAACAQRERVDFVAGTAPGAVWVPILVATTRGPDPDQPDIPGWARESEETFGRYTVSIPPDRERGEITRPRGRRAGNPERDFMLANAQQLSGPQFEDAVRQRLNEQAPDEREAVIFVHGFNTTFVEGVFRTAQLDHDLNLPGVMLHYSWPSLGAPLAYAHDRDSALFARDGMVQMIRRVAAAGPRRIILMAHSMGSHLTMETLRQMALTHDPALSAIGGVILISPDVDIELFRQQVRDIGPLPEPFLIITSQRDRVLMLSASLTGERARMGNMPSAQPVEGLGVTVVDVSAFSRGDGHFTVGSSPALIGLLNQMGAMNAALSRDTAGSVPLLPATILTLQNTTEVILTPLTEDPARRRSVVPYWLQRLTGSVDGATAAPSVR